MNLSKLAKIEVQIGLSFSKLKYMKNCLVVVEITFRFASLSSPQY